MPANPAAGVPVEQDSAAVTLSPNANLPDWITICPGGLRGMQYFLSQVKIDGIDSFRGQNLRNIIFNIPERLLLHEFSRGYNASGSFQTGDPAYGWDKMSLYSIANKDSTEVEDFPPLKNGDTFAYWACAVFLNICNWGTGSCRYVSDPPAPQLNGSGLDRERFSL
ncbi:hypothetical protein N7537_003823 [Penicillium hordei]|uniref:Uncharacterized protein n=1 Tax=Penicillium hordei TaxID=40994 RepID=A0AAD6EAK3_9EURO|nr:uncharacterized protein N7537_003823 [Penicillium hordei]KAJ5607204.1 hypothetical protein N7537_003823 [Penicillium hordei]